MACVVEEKKKVRPVRIRDPPSPAPRLASLTWIEQLQSSSQQRQPFSCRSLSLFHTTLPRGPREKAAYGMSSAGVRHGVNSGVTRQNLVRHVGLVSVSRHASSHMCISPPPLSPSHFTLPEYIPVSFRQVSPRCLHGSIAYVLLRRSCSGQRAVFAKRGHYPC
jgi:hypothetical protein